MAQSDLQQLSTIVNHYDFGQFSCLGISNGSSIAIEMWILVAINYIDLF